MRCFLCPMAVDERDRPLRKYIIQRHVHVHHHGVISRVETEIGDSTFHIIYH